MIEIVAWLVIALTSVILERTLANHDRGEPTAGAKAMDRVMVLATAFSLIEPLLANFVPGFGPILPISIVGLVIAVGGVVIRAWAMRTLGGRYVLTPQSQSDQHFLETRGPYGFVRHPGYSGILLQLLGMGLLLSPLVAVLANVPVVYFAWLRIKGEERILRREFEPEYQAYSLAVKWRLVKWVF